MAFGFHQAQGTRVLGGLRAVYKWRVTFNGQVIETLDPAEVALITHQFPNAIIEVVPCN